MRNDSFDDHAELEVLQAHAYVDNELDSAEVSFWKARLESSEGLQAHCVEILTMKSRLRTLSEKAVPSEASDRVFSECMRAVRRDNTARRTDQFVERFRYALAVGVASLVIGAAVLNWSSSERMQGASFAETLRASASGGANVLTLDAAWGWLRRAFGAEVAPPPLKLADLRPIRVEVLRSEIQCGRLVLEDLNGERYVFVFAEGMMPYDGEPVRGMPGFRYVRYGALNVICWTDGQYTYGLAGPREPSDLAAMIE